MSASRVIGVIPARMAATRFPGKPLALINGRPMIEWVVQGAQSSKRIRLLIVATDDERIASVCRKLGAEVEMTEPSLPSGTDRVYQAVTQSRMLALEADDIIVNIQGDEPLIDGTTLDLLVDGLEASQAAIATLGAPFADQAEGESEWLSQDVVKAIVGQNGHALYFTRAAAPFTRLAFRDREQLHPGGFLLRHIGLYAYRAAALRAFCQTPAHALERAEGLEQLRALAMGLKIRVIETSHRSWGVDSPSDVDRIEAILNQRTNRGLS